MFFSLAFIPVTAANNEVVNTGVENIILTLENKKIQYNLSEVNGIRRVMYQEEGENHIVTYDPSLNILMHDNKIIYTALQTIFCLEPNLLDLQTTATDSGEWVHYGTDVQVDIDISGMTAAAAVAAVIAVCGSVNPVAAAALGAIIAEFLLDNVSDVVALSVKKVSYYWEPITTQRPKTKTEFYLYSGTGCKPENLLYQF